MRPPPKPAWSGTRMRANADALDSGLGDHPLHRRRVAGIEPAQAILADQMIFRSRRRRRCRATPDPRPYQASRFIYLAIPASSARSSRIICGGEL